MQVVNYLLRGWIRSLEAEGSISLPLLDDLETPQHSVVQDLEFVREGVKRTVRVRFVELKYQLWNRISSFIESRFREVKLKSWCMRKLERSVHGLCCIESGNCCCTMWSIIQWLTSLMMWTEVLYLYGQAVNHWRRAHLWASLLDTAHANYFGSFPY